ncbi:uncharacterized protein N7487_001718 [Penicillium crustosum]|uniref:uncharacterized protein n=1 Tax=Penicillium crustosum TaxID=36656 RepID=UPI0023970813|nr:uncharacterized protein N7487_001718 [Penicillium crustosum]KAJ5418168.1 hypothetical protein N7487_001718 [Penicillium crustosum]
MATSASTITVPIPATAATRWQDAIDRLDPDTRASLAGIATRKLDILHLVVKTAHEKRNICISKQWKLKTPSGKTIILRDVLEKIAGWVNRLVYVGDNIVQYDPSHAALPWAAFRFLLNVAVGDVQVWGGMLVNLETIARLLYRCEVVENMHLKRSFSMMAHLQEAMTQLYVDIMSSLSRLVKYFKQGFPERTLWSATRSDPKLPEMTAVYAQEQEVLKWTALSDSELSQATNTQAASIMDKMAAISRKLDADLPRLIDTSLAMRHSIDEEKISNILSWLCTVPTTLHLRDIATRRMPGSGSWLLNHTDFHTWHTSSSSAILLLHGVRGCGKSTIASFVVDQFQQPSVVPGASPVPCAYFFCDDSNAEPERGRTDSILRGLIRQLAVDSVNKSIDQAVLSSYEKRLDVAQQIKADMARLSVDDCFSMLLDLTATNPAYIVIDAIDQLGQDERAVMIETMKKLVDQSASIIKVFFTSCNNAHVEGLLLGTTKLRITSDCVRTDVREFANRQVEQANARRRVLNGTATSKLIDKMKEHLISRAGEMFLWVTLQLEFLCRKRTEQDILTALETNLTPDLDQIYGRTLRRFNKLDSAATQAIMHVFSLLLYAQRPLHPTAVKRTLALNPSLAGAGVVDLEDLCCSLVMLDVSQGVARFCHPSVRDYMRQQEMFSAQVAHQILADICMLECASGPSSVPFFGDETPVEDFYHYAAVCWPEHIRECEASGVDHDFGKHAKSFIADQDDGFLSPAFLTWMDWIAQVCHDLPPYHRTRNLFENTLNDSFSPLFLTCVFGLRGLLLYVLEVLPDVDINQRSDTGHTGIYLASSYGHQDVVSILLDRNADYKLECGAFSTTTRVACFRGHLNVVQYLLGRIDELESPEPFSRAYRAACLGGHTEIALYLAKNCTAAQSADQHSIMLQETIKAGLPKVLEWLTKSSTLKSWGLPNLTLNAHTGLVTVAIKQGQVAVLKSLLEKRTHLMQSLPKDCIPIAATSGHLAMVEYLHSIGANPDEQGHFGSALRSASLVGCEPIVRMLIGKGIDVGLCGTEGDALQAASMNGHLGTMQLLIQAGANVNQVGKPWGTCLQAAAWYGHKDAVELLLSHGADIYQKGHSLDALHAAIESGHGEIAKLLLVKGYQPPKGKSLPAVSRGDHGSSLFLKGNPLTTQNLNDGEQALVEDDTESQTCSDSETSDVESSNRTTKRDDNDGKAENDDHDDYDDARAQHDDLAEGTRNLELSAVAGDIQSLRYHLLRGKFYDGAVAGAIESAVIHGQLETLSFLVTQGISRRLLFDGDDEVTKAMIPAAENGQSEGLQILGDASNWIYEPLSEQWFLPFEAAIQSGDLACVSMLLQHHPPPGETFMWNLADAIDTSMDIQRRQITEFVLLWLQKHSGLESPVVTANASDVTIPTASAAMISSLRMYLNPEVRVSKSFEDSRRVLRSFIVAATTTCDLGLLKQLLAKANARGYMKYNAPSKFLEDVFLSSCSHYIRGMELLFGCGLTEDCFPQQLICQGVYDAAFAGKAKMVSYLANKVLVNALSEESRSKLYYAFLAASYAGNSRVVQSMLDLTSFWNGIGEANKTTILTRGFVVAAEYGRRKTSDLLLKNGAEIHICVQEVPNPRGSDKNMASMVAFFDNQLPPAWEHAHRRQQPANPQVSSRIISPLQAVIRGFEKIALREDSDYGGSHSLVKLSRELESILGTIVELGCDPDDQGGQPMYPIQYAARWGNERVIQTLLDAGAEPNRLDEDDDEHGESRKYWSQGEKSCHPVLLAAERKCRFSYSMIATLLKGGATVPSTRQGQIHPAVRMSLCRSIMWDRRRTLLPYGSAAPRTRDHEYKSEALSIEAARQLFNDGMRALLIEIFKQLPQQRADKPEFQMLLTAASTAGDRVSVKLLLKHGALVNDSDQETVFDTPLGCAALYGHIHIMRELLNAGADPECKGYVGCPQDPMTKAIMGGHTAAVRLLVQSGAQRVRTEGRRSFLLVAARARNAQMVDCLLQLEFSIDGGSDALLVACATGDADIVSSFLSAGIDPNTPGKLDLNTLSKVESTPLYQASRRGHLAIVQELLKYGADPTKRAEEGLGVPLVIAANKGHLEIVRTLLDHGDVRAVEDLSCSTDIPNAIARTCGDSWSPAKANILELLLEVASQRSDFETIWTTAMSDESLAYRIYLIELLLDYIPPSPNILVLAASCGSTAAVQRCLARGIDPNSPNQRGYLPLASAARSMNKDLVQLLLSRGANVNELDVQGQTPLLGALEGFKMSLAEPTQKTSHGHHALDVEDTVYCLLEAGAKFKCGDSPEVLEFACSLGHTGIVTALLAHREADSSEAELQNGLFAALDKACPDNVSLLLKNGADPNRVRSLQSNDPRAEHLSQTEEMVEQTPLEAACGSSDDWLMRTFLASATELHIPPQVLITAARSSVYQEVWAECTDLALILEYDASLIVPDSVLEMLAAENQGKLLKHVLPRSRCSDPSRFETRPRPLAPRAPPTLSQMPADVLRPRYI